MNYQVKKFEQVGKNFGLLYANFFSLLFIPNIFHINFYPTNFFPYQSFYIYFFPHQPFSLLIFFPN